MKNFLKSVGVGLIALTVLALILFTLMFLLTFVGVWIIFVPAVIAIAWLFGEGLRFP